MTGWIIAGAAVLALVLLGWPLIALAGKLDQDEEDEYGVDKARRS